MLPLKVTKELQKNNEKSHQPIDFGKLTVDGFSPRQELPKILFFYRISCQKSIKEVNPIQHYETTDIFLGAYLLSSGGDLSGISFNDRQIATFMFTGVDLHQLDHAYRTGTALVNPVHLRASLNHLRDLLFDMRERRRRNDQSRRNRHNKARR